MDDVAKFGEFPFDRYTIAKWDPASPLSKEKQKRALFEQWLALGDWGRRELQEYMIDPANPVEIPAYVPRDLQPPEERKHSEPMQSLVWIRTWFGDSGNKASEQAADANYNRLVLHALQGGSRSGENDVVRPQFMFTGRDEFGTNCYDGNGDIENGVATAKAGSRPWYVVSSLMHCPRQLYGTPRGILDEAEWEKEQSVLFLVADRKACEEGFVLFLAINHRACVLPFRMRVRAYDVDIISSNWTGNGEPIQDNWNNPDEDIEIHLDEEEGWAQCEELD